MLETRVGKDPLVSFSDESEIHRRLRTNRQENLHRSLKSVSGVDFHSNDYLGLAEDQELQSRVLKYLEERRGTRWGATGSRLVSGQSALVAELEDFIATFHDAPTALVFGSGFLANLSLLSALRTVVSAFIYDQDVHASVHDGLRLTGKPSFPFRHHDLHHLESRLKKLSSPTSMNVVLTEAIFSMDGTRAPLKQLVALCQRYGAHLIVDEAHSVGVDGPNGEGASFAEGVSGDLFARVVTYGKAFGGHGAAILGSPDLRELVIQFGRPFVYSTGPALPQLLWIQEAYQMMPSLSERRQWLRQRVSQFRELKWKTPLCPSETMIQGLIFPGSEAVMRAADHFESKGIAVTPIRYPTVAKGAERIRVCLHSKNTFEQLNLLFQSALELT